MPGQEAYTRGCPKLVSGKGSGEVVGSAEPAGPTKPRTAPEWTQSLCKPARGCRRGTPPGLWGSSEEQRSEGISPSSWGHQGRRHSHTQPFLGAQERGPVCRPGRRHASRGTGRHYVVKLMRPQGLPPGWLMQQVGMAPSTSALPDGLGCPENSGTESPGPSPGLLREGLQDTVS